MPQECRWLSESVQSDGSTSRDLLKPLYYAEKDFKFPSRIWTYLPLYHDSETSVPKMMTEKETDTMCLICIVSICESLSILAWLMFDRQHVFNNKDIQEK